MILHFFHGIYQYDLFFRGSQFFILFYFLYLFYSSSRIYLSWDILMKFLFSINDMSSNEMCCVGFCMITMTIETIYFLISNKIKVACYLIFLKETKGNDIGLEREFLTQLYPKTIFLIYVLLLFPIFPFSPVIVFCAKKTL